MPSSTSSSEQGAQRREGRRFALAVLLWGLVFLCAYGAWFVIAAPEVNTFQNHSARNIDRAEGFLHGDRDRAILVGSSLTQMLPQEALGEAIYNMGFSRESALTGLSIIAQAPRPPSTVIVEVNYILREVNEDFVSDRLAPMGLALKDTLPVLQTAAQPMNVLLSAMRGGYGRSVAQKMEDKVDPDTLTRLLADRLSDFAEAPESAALNAALETLSGYIESLSERGSRVFLLMMPVEPPLEQTPYARAIREALYETFPKERFSWIDTSREAPYRTTDSEHLLYADAWDLAERIARSVSARSGSKEAISPPSVLKESP